MKGDNAPLPINEAMLIQMLSGVRTFCVLLAGPQPVYSAFCEIAGAKPADVPVTDEDRDIGYAAINKDALRGILTAILTPVVCASGAKFVREILSDMMVKMPLIENMAAAIKHDNPDVWPPEIFA